MAKAAFLIRARPVVQGHPGPPSLIFMGSFSVFPVAGLLLKKLPCQLFANFLGNQIRCHAASDGTRLPKYTLKHHPVDWMVGMEIFRGGGAHLRFFTVLRARF